MKYYRYKDSSGTNPDEITVIEDKSMFVKDRDGNWSPGFEYIDNHTVKAHPFIIGALLEDCERVYTEGELREFMHDLERLPL